MTATVTVRPSGMQFPAADGQTIMAAGIAAGYRWPTICGGQGDCLVCHVEVLEGSENLQPAAESETTATATLRGARGEHVRLACQAAVHGDVVVLKRGIRRERSQR